MVCLVPLQVPHHYRWFLIFEQEAVEAEGCRMACLYRAQAQPFVLHLLPCRAGSCAPVLR